MAEHGVHALGQLSDELFQVGGFQAVRHTLAVNFAAQRHVAGDAVVEHHHVLADKRKLRPQGGQVPVFDRYAIQQDVAGIRVSKARQQVHQRAFARARRADNRHRFARVYAQADVVERRVGFGLVAQCDATDADVAAGTGQLEAAAAFVFNLVEQLHAALERGQAARDGRGRI